MSIKLMSAIFETEFRDLTDDAGNITKASTAKLVLLAMADKANDEGDGIYPSVDSLSKKTALSPQTIRNTWDALKYNGIILLVGKSKYGTNNHSINTSCFPKLHGEDNGIITLYPLDPSNQLTPLTSRGDPSNQSLLPLNRLDPNHPLTTIKSSIGVETPNVENLPIEWQIAGGVSELQNTPEQQEQLACNAFERAFGIDRPWNWYPPKDEQLWSDFRAKLLSLWQADNDCFTGYAAWANNKYSRGAKNASQLRRDPGAFWDAWAAYKASEMYKKTDEERPAYAPIPERIKTPKPAHVPAPNLKRNQP